MSKLNDLNENNHDKAIENDPAELIFSKKNQPFGLKFLEKDSIGLSDPSKPHSLVTNTSPQTRTQRPRGEGSDTDFGVDVDY
jgi:hypothetical protein